MLRNPVDEADSEYEEDTKYINQLADHAMPASLTRDGLIVAVIEDPKLKALTELVRNGRVEGAEKDALSEYPRVLGELTLTEDGLVLRGTQLIIPQSLKRDLTWGLP